MIMINYRRQRSLHPKMFVLDLRAPAAHREPRPELLLMPPIPPDLYGINPRSIEGPTWWDKERRAAFQRACNVCEACGTHRLDAEYHQWLEGHETYAFDYKKHETTYTGTVALCHACHWFVHRKIGEDYKRHEESKRIAIRQRGYRLLEAAGLVIPDFPPYPTFWAKRWVLIYKGERYA
jgi:hypothetical protein